MRTKKISGAAVRRAVARYLSARLAGRRVEFEPFFSGRMAGEVQSVAHSPGGPEVKVRTDDGVLHSVDLEELV